MKAVIVLENCKLKKDGTDCFYLISGMTKSWTQPCECTEAPEYYYCEYDSHGAEREKLFSKCPFVEAIK